MQNSSFSVGPSKKIKTLPSNDMTEVPLRIMSKKSLAQNITKAVLSQSRPQPCPIKVRDDKEGYLQLCLHVKPGAKVSRIAEITEVSIGMQISAPPRDGEANEEVVRYLAEILKLKERQITLISGHKSRDKIVLIEGNGRSVDDIRLILINSQD